MYIIITSCYFFATLLEDVQRFYTRSAAEMFGATAANTPSLNLVFMSAASECTVHTTVRLFHSPMFDARLKSKTCWQLFTPNSRQCGFPYLLVVAHSPAIDLVLLENSTLLQMGL